MKKLLTTVVFLTIAATPVFAQSFAPEYGSGNIVSGTNQGGEGSYAQAPENYEMRAISTRGTFALFVRPRQNRNTTQKMNLKSNAKQ
jgi:hypothetical protein